MAKRMIPRGSTPETAIVVSATCSEEAISMENEHLSRMFGSKWEQRLQCLVTSGSRSFDCITIEVGRRTETIYFDITSCFPVGNKKGVARMPPGK